MLDTHRFCEQLVAPPPNHLPDDAWRWRGRLVHHDTLSSSDRALEPPVFGATPTPTTTNRRRVVSSETDAVTRPAPSCSNVSTPVSTADRHRVRDECRLNHSISAPNPRAVDRSVRARTSRPLLPVAPPPNHNPGADHTTRCERDRGRLSARGIVSVRSIWMPRARLAWQAAHRGAGAITSRRRERDCRRRVTWRSLMSSAVAVCRGATRPQLSRVRPTGPAPGPGLPRAPSTCFDSGGRRTASATRHR